jgi:hypothetical protein
VFKNIILKEKLSSKFNNDHENFSRVHGFPKTMRFGDLQGSRTREKFFMTIFGFIGQFIFQNNVFKLQEVFSELEIRVFVENGLESFQLYLILQI